MGTGAAPAAARGKRSLRLRKRRAILRRSEAVTENVGPRKKRPRTVAAIAAAEEVAAEE